MVAAFTGPPVAGSLRVPGRGVGFRICFYMFSKSALAASWLSQPHGVPHQACGDGYRGPGIFCSSSEKL